MAIAFVRESPARPTTPIPVTWREGVSALEEKFTLPANVPVDVGLKRTDVSWLCPALRLKELPETMLKGAVVETLPVSVPPPVFCTVKLLSAELPTLMSPKLREAGLTETATGMR